MALYRFYNEKELEKFSRLSPVIDSNWTNGILEFSYSHPAIASVYQNTERKARFTCSLELKRGEATEFVKRLTQLISNPIYWSPNMEADVEQKFGKLIALAFFVPMKKVRKADLKYRAVMTAQLNLLRLLDEPVLPVIKQTNNETRQLLEKELEYVQNISNEILNHKKAIAKIINKL